MTRARALTWTLVTIWLMVAVATTFLQGCGIQIDTKFGEA